MHPLQTEIAPLRVAVPEFIGLSGAEIKSLLKVSGLDVEAEWNHIVGESLGESPSKAMGQAFSERLLPKSFLEASKVLAKKIRQFFDKIADQAHKVYHRDLQSFLTYHAESNSRLMVRSTGKEDTDQLANAGGNRSEANVSSELSSVLRAIGSVVSSYFEEKSLTQRIIAGDNSVFRLPLTAALIQRMVGEQFGGASLADQIPSGCVVFTVEPAGGVKTVNTIQCSFGSAESVVNSLHALDTYYVRDGGRIYPLVKSKYKRLIPDAKGDTFGLKEVDNPKEIHNRAALPRPVVLAISKIASRIAAHYAKPMDIELMYLPRDKTIYLVQARPLIVNESKGEPSYIAKLSDFPNDRIGKFQTIVPGDSAVIEITNPKQILVANTLKNALDQYTASNKDDRAALQVVFAEDEVDITSHEATTFRSANKHIVYSRDNTQLKKWLREDKLSLLVDLQRGVTVKLAKLETKNALVRSGWHKYPLSQTVSVGRYDNESYCVKSLDGVNFSEEELCHQSKHQEDLYTFEKRLDEIRFKASCEESTPLCAAEKLLAELTLESLETLGSQANEYLKDIKLGSDGLDKLLSANFFTALFLQSKNDNIVGQESIAELLKEYEKKSQLLDRELLPRIAQGLASDEILRDSRAFALSLLGLDMAFSSESKDRWVALISELISESDPLLFKDFSSFVDTILGLKVFGVWVNLHDSLSIDGYQKSKLELTSSGAYLEELGGMLYQLNSYDLSIWLSSEDFSSNLERLSELADLFKSQAFFSAPNLIAQFVMLANMEKLTELFDQAIKTLKSSTYYKDQRLQVVHFKTLIRLYLELLKNWAPRVDSLKFPLTTQNTIDSYLEESSGYFESTSDSEDTLLPSPDFSVNAAAIGSQARFSRHIPKTAEDVFTLIHQSLNSVIGQWLNHTVGNAFEFPEKIIKHIDALQGDDSCFVTGIEAKQGKLTVRLSLPLRNHAMRIELHFDNNRQESMTVKYMFVGRARERWSMVKDFVELSTAMGDEFNEPSFEIDNAQEIQFSLSISDRVGQDRLETFNRYLHLIANQNIADILLASFAMELCDPDKSNCLERTAKVGDNQLIVPFVREEIHNGNYSEGITFAKMCLEESSSTAVKENAYEILEHLVGYDHGFAVATEAAAEAIGSEHPSIRDIGKNLFWSLFLKDQSFREAEAAGLRHAVAEDAGIRATAFSLLELLARHSPISQNLVTAAAKGIEDTSHAVIDHSFNLLGIAVLYNRGLKEAAAAAFKGIDSDSNLKRRRAIVLFEKLLARKEGIDIDEVEQAALNAASSDLLSVKKSGFLLLKRLVAVDRVTDKMVAMASQGIKVNSLIVMRISFDILNLAVTKGLGYDEAVSAAEFGADSHAWDIVEKTADLLFSLVNKGVNYELAESTAGSWMAKEDARYALLSLKLLRILVIEGRAIGLADKAVLCYLDDENVYVGEKAQGLASLLEDHVGKNTSPNRLFYHRRG